MPAKNTKTFILLVGAMCAAIFAPRPFTLKENAAVKIDTVHLTYQDVAIAYLFGADTLIVSNHIVVIDTPHVRQPVYYMDTLKIAKRNVFVHSCELFRPLAGENILSSAYLSPKK